MHLALRQCTDKRVWDRIVESSPQGNIFCDSRFLDSLGEEYDLFLVEEDGRAKLGAVVLKRAGQPLPAPHPFTLYQGCLFDEASTSLPHHSRAKWSLDVTTFLLGELERRYHRLSFCLHHTVSDLRSFQWFHYHEPQRGQFRIDLRYTGLLDLAGIPDFEAYLLTIRKVRRYEYRRALSDGLVIEESNDLETLRRLYHLTFERQGIEQSPKDEGLMLRIAEAALRHGFGHLLLCKAPKGVIASATLFLYDQHTGYYLVAANDPEYRKSDTGTYLMLENIRRCKEAGVREIDFVGINSPNRGDFKTSFNAAPVPYFVVDWDGSK